MKRIVCKVNETCIYEYIAIGFFYCHNLYQVKHVYSENSTFTLNNNNNKKIVLSAIRRRSNS